MLDVQHVALKRFIGTAEIIEALAQIRVVSAGNGLQFLRLTVCMYNAVCCQSLLSGA